ncbi:MAG TPA: phospholipase D-like domain-containing protein, partial [Enhygromyxa sp.]|nr:phospholipase D-like domain-containing protein [Enhygromyxa sp.]
MPAAAALRVAFPLLVAASLLACDSPRASTSPDRSTPEQSGPTAGDPDGTIRLLLNDPSDRTAPSEACDNELCTSLLELIEKAETSIDFAIYGLRGQPRILAALEAAKARGVKIRAIVDRDVAGENYYADTDAMARALGNVRDDRKVDAALEREQKQYDRANRFDAEPSCKRPDGFQGFVQCLAYDLGDRCLLATHASREQFASEDDSDGTAFNKIMHHKFFVVDGRYVWTGSTNVSDSDAGGYSANVVVVLDSPTLAGWYTREFETMWVDGKHHQHKPKNSELRTKVGDAEVQLLFSPQDKAMNEGVRPVLKRAQKRIDIAVFFLNHKAITKD